MKKNYRIRIVRPGRLLDNAQTKDGTPIWSYSVDTAYGWLTVLFANGDGSESDEEIRKAAHKAIRERPD